MNPAGVASASNPYLSAASTLTRGVQAAQGGPAYSSARGGKQSAGTGRTTIHGPTFGGGGGVSVGTPTVLAVAAVAGVFVWYRWGRR